MENQSGSEGKRVAKFSQPLRNGPTKLDCSCEISLQNLAGEKDMLSKNFLLYHPASLIEQFLQNKHSSIK